MIRRMFKEDFYNDYEDYYDESFDDFEYSRLKKIHGMDEYDPSDSVLCKKIIKLEEKYVTDNDVYPKYLIISSGTIGELYYEIGKEMGLSEEEALTFETAKWRGMWICIVNSSKFDKSFILR